MSTPLQQRTPGAPAERDAFLAALWAILPGSSLLASEEEKKPYECDGLSAYRQLPGLVALPETIEQVRRVIRACREHGVSVFSRHHSHSHQFIAAFSLMPKREHQYDIVRFEIAVEGYITGLATRDDQLT